MLEQHDTWCWCRLFWPEGGTLSLDGFIYGIGWRRRSCVDSEGGTFLVFTDGRT
jgi:hypothetical protein